MTYINPISLEGQRKRWLRHDWRNWVKPQDHHLYEPLEEKRALRFDEVARQRKAEAAAIAAEKREQEALEQELLELRRDFATLKLDYELRRFRAKYRLDEKYNPDQPRVPAGNPNGGQWTSDGAGIAVGVREERTTPSAYRDGRIRLAGDPPVPLQRIHPDTTYDTDTKAKRSLEYWKGQPTDRIVESLKPGREESLKTYPDGRIFNGNTRVKILHERGYDVNSLPREMWRSGPFTPLRPRGGGSSGLGGLPTQQ